MGDQFEHCSLVTIAVFNNASRTSQVKTINLFNFKVQRRPGVKVLLFTLPKIGEKLRFQEQVSDVSYAYVPDYLLRWAPYNWKTADLVLSHSLESL